jgi:hypothetical protein
MSNGSELDRLLAEAAEKIRKEAYSAGWRDALSAISKAVADSADLGPSNMDSGSPIEIQRSVTSTGPAPGTTPFVALLAIKKQPGMTGAEVVEAVGKGGHPASEGSIRTSIGRLKERKLIVARHGKWYPV